MQPAPNFSPYPQSGEVLDGKYRIERMLGEGGMGAVAKATHLLRRAPVALKFMSGAVLSLPGAVERFVNEGVAASQIDSDHVVKVFDVGRLPSGAPYLVMEFLDGCDLGQLLGGMQQRIDIPRAVHFALQMLRALQTAHAAGIIHRDMKPSNCFVINKDGEPDFVKLVDFGISKVRASDNEPQGAHLTRTNSALGTPLYMSPEQARSPRDVDHRTDIYSVGAILYEMLSGRTPYTAESGEYTEILFKIFTTDPEPLHVLRPDLPPGLADVVHRALVRDRNTRYGSAGEFAEALAPYADGRSGAILTRLQGRSRSINPPMPPGYAATALASMPGTSVPLSGGAPAPPGSLSGGAGVVDPSQVRARTYPNSSDSMRPPTAMGVSREATAGAPPASRSGRAGVFVGIAAVVVVLGVGTFGLVKARATWGKPIGHEPTATVTTTAPPPTVPPTVSTPATSLTPLPSVTATTPPSATAPTASSSVTKPPKPPGTPSGLGGIHLND
jgi:serine/threonine-protein kinase